MTVHTVFLASSFYLKGETNEKSKNRNEAIEKAAAEKEV